MKISILYPQQPSDVARLAPYARLVREHDLARLWTGQSFVVESHVALASLAGQGLAVPVGIGTALAALRTPYDAALQARSLAMLLGERVDVAYGAADPAFVTSITGAPLARPATYTAEYARLVRQLLDGDLAVSDLERLRMSAQLPPVAHPEVQVGAGVLRPGMARRARDTDFAVTWLSPPGYVRDTLLPALTRPDGSRPRVVSHIHLAVERPGRNPYLLAQMGCGNHLAREHYVSMLRQAGLDISTHDPVSGARQLVQHRVLRYGSPDALAEELLELGGGVLDEIILNLTPVSLTLGDDAALTDLHEIVGALSARQRPAPAVR